MEPKTVVDMFRQICRENAARTAYMYKHDGHWHGLTWADQEAAVKRVGKALIAAGIRHGDRVGILAQTRLEWVQADLGTNNVGAVTMGVYPSMLGPDCAYVLSFSGTRLLVLDTPQQLDKILHERPRIPSLEKIVILDGPANPTHDVITWDEFLAQGDAVSDEEFERRAGAVKPGDLAALVATSGTTGQQKLAMITHDNLVFTCGSVLSCVPVYPHYLTLLFLPLAHVFARVIAYVTLRAGATLAFAEDLTKVGENLRETKPHYIASVPRIFEKVHEKILGDVAAAGGMKAKICHWAFRNGVAVSRLRQKGQPVPAGLRLRYALADRLVFHKIRAALGGRLVFAISGAAPLNPALGEFFHAAGVLVLEGLGMTENTSFSNLNRLETNRFGTVGQPGPGVEMKRAADGEILFRGRNVMQGYYNNPDATAEVLDAEGWLATGDVGEIDADGALRITDRKKDLIITAGGKNVAPQRIERYLRNSPYVSQAVAFGDKRKFISALLALNADALTRWATERSLPAGDWTALLARPEVRDLLEREVAQANEQLASFEQVKKFEILPRELTIEDGELTPTLKVKRKVVATKYAALVEKLYAEGGERASVES